MKNMRVVRYLILLLTVTLLPLSLPAMTSHTQRRNPEAGKKKAAKRIGIGTAIGAGAGGLIGGRKGALIGAGAGAAGGTAYHVHRKRKYARRHR